jgi:hypothetical protein
MKTSNFEAVKVAIKQDKTGYILTLSIHPDDIPEEVMRDFVGARYQVVMVRINGDEQPMNREREIPLNPVQMAGRLCRDPVFMRFVHEVHDADERSEAAAANWLREQLGVKSRVELAKNPSAQHTLNNIIQEFRSWKES